MGFEFKPNPSFAADVLTSVGIELLLRALLEPMVASAKADVPVDEGDLRDSIDGDVVREEGRLKGHLFASDFKAGWYEFGNSRVQARHFLQGAAEAQGLSIEASND